MWYYGLQLQNQYRFHAGSRFDCKQECEWLEKGFAVKEKRKQNFLRENKCHFFVGFFAHDNMIDI